MFFHPTPAIHHLFELFCLIDDWFFDDLENPNCF
uniref:Uncharacterized protein n=1 Tax=Rhizophora mucronata TaxID=61149 RepID=A0A2P2NLQ5_RHIMU